jgi:hypothetical protein
VSITAIVSVVITLQRCSKTTMEYYPVLLRKLLQLTSVMNALLELALPVDFSK